jgi:oligopeptide transport system substrate-binding protein
MEMSISSGFRFLKIQQSSSLAKQTFVLLMRMFFLIFLFVVVIFGWILYMPGRVPKKNVELLSNHLRVNLSEGDPASLHPHRSVDVRGRMIGKALFEGLTRLNANGEAELAAANKVDIDPSYMHFRFSIRPHYWTNGQTVTAYDFEKAWKTALHPDTRCSRADLFYIIKNAKKAKCGEVSLDDIGVKALDATTLIVELQQPAPYFLALISHSIFSPICDEEGEPTIFNGPFILGNWKHRSMFELERNSKYWDAENVKLHKVSISMIADPNTEFSLFEKGEYDVMGDTFDSIPEDLLSTAKKDPRFQTEVISRIYWLYLNTEAPPFHSTWIRKAFAYAINRQNLIKNFLTTDIPCTTILPKTLSLIDETLGIDENHEKAVQFFEQGLQELGLTRKTFPKVTISYCTYGSQKSLTQILQENLRETLGIDVEIQAFEWNVLLDHLIHGQFQIASCTRNAMYEDPFYFLDIFKEKNCSYNFSRWENKIYQQLLAQASTTFDMKERGGYLREAEKLLLDEMPVIPIYMDTCKFLLNDKLRGYAINRSGYVDFKGLSLAEVSAK